MKLRDDIRPFGQGMRARTASRTSKYGVGYRVVADTHPSGAYHRGSSTAMGGASLELVDYCLGLSVLLEGFFGLWRPSCPAGLKLVVAPQAQFQMVARWDVGKFCCLLTMFVCLSVCLSVCLFVCSFATVVRAKKSRNPRGRIG